MFIDESGQDHHDSPYEVLAGICIQDKDLWNIITAIHQVEILSFGRKYRDSQNEIKAKRFLKRKTFKLAAQLPAIPLEKRTQLAKSALDDGSNITRESLTALAQAKLDYVSQILEICNQFRIKIFASIIHDPVVLPEEKHMLRKDYIYLFERFFYYLEDITDQRGIVVFDELDKSASHLVLDQMEKYFKRTSKGRLRSSLIIPEPFFVHSDLTTGIQIVDFIAYILSWNFRAGKLEKESRRELEVFLDSIRHLRYKTSRVIGGEKYEIWSIVIV